MTDGRMVLCFVVLAVSCLCSVPGVSAANKVTDLWEVMDSTKQDFGLFWEAVNKSGYVQTPGFKTLSEGDYTILAPSNRTLRQFAELYKIDMIDLKDPNITRMLYPLIEYHVIKKVQKFSTLPLKKTETFETMLAGKTNSLCPTAGTLNITRVSNEHAIVSAGGNKAVVNLTAEGPISSNDAYAVYGIDNVLSPCCLDLDFGSLDLSSILTQPELGVYIKGLNLASPIVTKISGFLTFALNYIKENGDKLNANPVTIVLPYPDVIAAALEGLTEDMKNENTYAAIFLNHIIPQSVTYDTVTAANNSQAVTTMLDVEYGPFKCAAQGLNVTVDPTAENYTQLLPVFGATPTDTGYSLCSGSQVYFAQSIIMPCNLADAIDSVANNYTAAWKASQSTTGSDSAPAVTGGTAGSTTAPAPANKTVNIASPAAAVRPQEWLVAVVAALSLLLALVL